MAGEDIFIESYLDEKEISDVALYFLGFRRFNRCWNYWCPPAPANGGTYRIEYAPTLTGGGVPPRNFKWRAFLTDDNSSTVRSFKNLKELNEFHKGMCGKSLYDSDKTIV